MTRVWKGRHVNTTPDSFRGIPHYDSWGERRPAKRPITRDQKVIAAEVAEATAAHAQASAEAAAPAVETTPLKPLDATAEGAVPATAALPAAEAMKT